MKKLQPLMILPLMLLGAFLIPSVAHATGGQVSINGGAFIGVPASQTSVSVPIEISGPTAQFNTFDVLVQADPTVLTGSSVSLTGSVLTGAAVVEECINGILIVGHVCAPQDVPGVVHLVASTLGAGTSASGTLFTINYAIVGSSDNTPITFVTGCSNTSIPNGDCVTIQSGGVAASETDLGATFSNLISFKMTPDFASVSTPLNTMLNDNINFHAQGGFSDILTDSVTASAGLTATLSSGGLVDLTTTSGTYPNAVDTLTVSAAAAGDYSATVSACGTNNFPTTCKSQTISVKVAAPGFSIKLSQSGLTISRGDSDTSTTVTATGFSSFSGMVTYSSSSSALITGTAPTATLTPNGSGASTATSTLTITVDKSVASGTYTLTVKGTSGSMSSASIAVTVPDQDFDFAASPNAVTIIRGGTLATNLALVSKGNFDATITFSPVISPVAGQQDSCCLTNNITPAFSPVSIHLTAKGTVIVFFFASTIGGSAPASSFTATGNYTATVTATGGGVTHTAVITFNIIDFSVGPGWCAGGNAIITTPNANSDPVFVNTTCATLSITDQPNVLFFPAAGATAASLSQQLWVQTNALGGLVTDGFDGTPAVAALNPEIPANGVLVPQIAVDFPKDGFRGFSWPHKMCLLPTFWPNGTQIPYSYLEANGPLVTPGSGLYAFLSTIFKRSGVPIVPPGALGNWGCKFDAGAYPNDFTAFESGVPNTNNPDFFGVTAMSIVGTLPGDYTFKLCAQSGVLVHCATFGLNVLASAVAHQLTYTHRISCLADASGNCTTIQNMKLGVTNPSTHTVFAQVDLTGIGSAGDTFDVFTSVFSIAPNANANNIALSVQLTKGMIGETFTFAVTIIESADPNNLTGTSTEAGTAVTTGTFTVGL